MYVFITCKQVTYIVKFLYYSHVFRIYKLYYIFFFVHERVFLCIVYPPEVVLIGKVRTRTEDGKLLIHCLHGLLQSFLHTPTITYYVRIMTF